MKRSRILLVSHSAGLAGAERSLLRIASALQRDAFDLFVLLPRHGPLEERLGREGIPTVVAFSDPWLAERNNLPFFLARVARSSLVLRKVLKAASSVAPDLIYTNSLVTPIGALIARHLRRPHIWHVREYVPGNETLRSPIPLDVLLTFVTTWSRRVIAVSDSVVSQFPSSRRGNIRRIYNAIEPIAPVSQTIRRDVRPRLVVLGSLAQAKGQIVALEALRLLVRRFPTIHLDVIGTGRRRYVQALERFVDDHGLTSNVTFHGFQLNPHGIMAGADLTLMPSRAEAFGLVTLESLALGIPVVGSASGGTPEILSRGGGILVPPGDPRELARAVEHLLETPSERHRLAAEGLAVVRYFSAAREFDAIKMQIAEVLSAAS